MGYKLFSSKTARVDWLRVLLPYPVDPWAPVEPVSLFDPGTPFKPGHLFDPPAPVAPVQWTNSRGASTILYRSEWLSISHRIQVDDMEYE